MNTLKKEHRGLRRRPLYTPLGIVIVALGATLLLGLWLVASWGTTTVILVRHGERMHEGSDTALSVAGHERALRLAQTLANAEIAAIYVSDARRTQETAAVVASATGIEPRVLPAERTGRLVRRLKWRHRNEVVLVVGHSHTIPGIADGLGASIGPIGAGDYSGLWIVTYSRLRGTRRLSLSY